jgi:predicted deacetylase
VSVNELGAPGAARALFCVAIHDVAPATWDACAGLARAVREVSRLPLSWLVVPRYHMRADDERAMRRGLDRALERGDELVLHGYTHLDPSPRAARLKSRLVRGVWTRNEGEFAALAPDEVRARLALGLAWFRQRDWPVSGFVAPAWLLGEGAWQVLPEFALSYTTTLTHFHLLREQRALFAPSLLYMARNRSGRACSPLGATLVAQALARAPLLRLALHPPDRRYPRLLAHAQRLVERMLVTREAVTKAESARRLASLAYQALRPQTPPPSGRPRPVRSTANCRNAGLRLSCSG